MSAAGRASTGSAPRPWRPTNWWAGAAGVDEGQLEQAAGLLRDLLAKGPLPLAEVTASLAKQSVARRPLGDRDDSHGPAGRLASAGAGPH